MPMQNLCGSAGNLAGSNCRGDFLILTSFLMTHIATMEFGSVALSLPDGVARLPHRDLAGHGGL